MPILELTAEKTTKAMFAEVSITTESMTDPEDKTKELYRLIFRVVVEQEAENVVDIITPPTLQLDASAALTARFNQDVPVTLYPFSVNQPFMLTDQVYTPMESKGSKFMLGVKTWVSVSEFLDLNWYTA